MDRISVEKTAVINAIKLCNQSIYQFKQASGVLSAKYQTAGNFWKDNKYKQLGEVVNDCNIALHKPVKELEECITKLNEILKTIELYESTNL